MKKTATILLVWTLSLLAWGGVRAANPEGEVRNLIFMVGDGMGLAHVSMLMVENGYAPTSFDRAQSVGLVCTRSANNRVTDSAAAATALATGHKTGNGTIGQSLDGERYESLMMRAEKAGLRSGIVVSCYLQHATPAAFYAHVARRGDVDTITRDLLASGVDVLFGGGRKWLAEECSDGGTYFDAFRRRGYTVVNRFEQTDTLHSGRVLGAFAEKHLEAAPRRGDYLPRATRKALELLTADDSLHRGWMLLVEGSLIDMAAHDNDAERLLAEMRDFNAAVGEAMDYADAHPGTLVVVVADHETGGLSIPANDEDFTQAENGLQYNFGSKSHTGTLVPVYFYGTGAGRLGGVMDNTQLSQRLALLLGLPQN